MRLPLHAIKLSDHDCNLLNDLITKFPKTGIELLLVASGVKTGDIIEAYELDGTKDYFKKVFSQLESKEYLAFQEVGDRIIFYNNSIEDDILERVIKFNEGMGNDDVAVGIFYGYPLCCCEVFDNNKPIIRKTFTEHFWCSENCEESQRIAGLYKEAIQLNAPEFMPLLEWFNCLGNNATRYYTLICELINKVPRIN